MNMGSFDTIQFAPFRSFVDPSFFQILSAKKLNEYKLDESEKSLTGVYSIPASNSPGNSCIFNVSGDSFGSSRSQQSSSDLVARGSLLNVNTVEEFKAIDKSKVIQAHGLKIWESIKSNKIVEDPSQLSSFLVLCFSDLKKYKFYYWFAYPAIHTDWVFTGEDAINSVDLESSRAIALLYEQYKRQNDFTQHGFFLLKQRKGEWVMEKLAKWDDFFKDGSQVTIGFADPSTFLNPGWPLRNLLALLKWKGLKKARILSFRDLSTIKSENRSLWIDLKLPEDSTLLNYSLKITGWERTLNNKLAPKTSDLAPLMDPTRLADQAVDLNLKLMRWRIAPSLDLDIVKSTKCLLLGAGTLGSYVARALMGWGVHKITFVDNATVSFSNPVRQPLYNFNDCLGGGAPKAIRAAEALREIYPGVNSCGHLISVPMAGHPISDEATQKREYDKLVRLIEEHDALFLLMDSREARWLPTIIGAAKHKIVINAAIGFDSYVVMRHGVPLTESQIAQAGERLGCYFCNDIYAPADSLSDRTLDQMCTVTRPGVALLASGMAVELLVSILQHKLGPAAPAMTSSESANRYDDEFDHPLGVVPHQIRGFLRNFQQMNIKGQNYTFCSACSEPILHSWESDGWEFVKNALNIPGFVDELSGLAEVQRKADEVANDDDWDIDEDI
ncbi:hypothetical protein V1511DRAFT_506390 [Dipodascopsis uninucleata]